MKETAVEWVINEIRSNWYDYEYGDEDMNELIKKAKEMEKWQIIDAHESGVGSIDYGYGIGYYEETYKNETND
jgi:hypothetical protein